jgi:hypothetical protein
MDCQANERLLFHTSKPKTDIEVDAKAIFTVLDRGNTAAILKIIDKCGIDAYFFLRYLRTQLYIFLPACAMAVPVLIPLNYISGNGRSVVSDGSEASEKILSRVVGLDTLAWGNIRPDNTKRYAAHLVCAVVIILWACMVFFHEFRWYVNIRQRYLTSPMHRQSISATTILVSSIPHVLLGKETILKEIFDAFPGGVKRIWFRRDLNKLLRTVKRRHKVRQALEKALTEFIVNVSKAYTVSPSDGKRVWGLSSSITYGAAAYTTSVWRKFEPKIRILSNEIPWLPGIPLLCKKRNAIEWYSNELRRLDEFIKQEQVGILKNEQKYLERYPLLNSAYVQFNSQIAAHMACQSVIHRMPWHMSPRICEISPRDIIWSNMAITWWQELARTAVVVVILIAMVVLWAVPVAWSAALGQLSNLIQAQGWLSFLRRNALIEYAAKALAGVLPAAVIELLLFAVPLILTGLARMKGARTGSQETEFVQMVYFIFLFTQVFLVVSIASFFTVTLGEYLNNLKELQTVEAVLNLLAQNLPKAANYFLCYMILQSLVTSSATLLQIRRLLSWFVVGPLSDVTPRQGWTRRQEVGKMDWGSFFPVYTNFACVGLIYSVIAPLILICTVIMFSLLWLSHGYSMARVNHFKTDTGGIFYPRAINQTFTGLYVMELCMAGLFFCVVDEEGSRTCTVHGFFMIASLVLTIAYQIVLNSSFTPLFNYLPVQLVTDREASASQCRGEIGREGMSSEEMQPHPAQYTSNLKDPILDDDIFEHPALRTNEPVWIPKAQVEAINDMVRNMIPVDIEVSIEGAVVEDGHVEIHSGPPTARPIKTHSVP